MVKIQIVLNKSTMWIFNFHENIILLFVDHMRKIILIEFIVYIDYISYQNQLLKNVLLENISYSILN
jgi:hypothetical protein